MSYERIIKTQVENIWIRFVFQKFVYRGMDKSDLIFPLDPKKNPFEPYKTEIQKFFNIVDKICDAGHNFKIIETHFGKKYYHDPKKISIWSRRDLNKTGIDFTSIYENAVEYSDCWQGSQLKQNIKSLSEYLLSNANNRICSRTLTKNDIDVIHELNNWVNKRKDSNPIVIHVRRDNDFFEASNQLLPLGTKDLFCQNVMNKICEHKINNHQDIITLLPNETEEFFCSICRPISEQEISKIEIVKG